MMNMGDPAPSLPIPHSLTPWRLRHHYHCDSEVDHVRSLQVAQLGVVSLVGIDAQDVHRHEDWGARDPPTRV